MHKSKINGLSLFWGVLIFWVPVIAFANSSGEEIEALVVKGFAALDVGNFDLADQLSHQAQSVLDRGPTEQESLLDNVLAVHQSNHQKNNWPKLRILQLMGAVRHQQGKLKQAEPYFREILGLSNGQYPEMNFFACNMLANVLGLTNRLAEAEKTLVTCLPVGKATRFSSIEKQVVASYVEVLRAVGKYAEAENYGKSLIAELQQQSDTDHLALAKLKNNLARVVSSKEAGGRWSDAEGLLREALAHYKVITTEDDLDYLDAAGDLGIALLYSDKLDEAEEILNKVVKARIRLNEDHPNTAIASERLALVYFLKRRYEDAEPLLMKAVSSYKKIYGRNALSDGVGRGAYELLIKTLKALNKDKELGRLQRNTGIWIIR